MLGIFVNAIHLQSKSHTLGKFPTQPFLLHLQSIQLGVPTEELLEDRPAPRAT